MTLVQRFAQVFGAIYLLVGIMGFIPPLIAAKTPDSSFMGLLIGLFFVTWLHSLAHLLIGVAGLATYRNFAAAKAYALTIGVAYTLLFVLGLIFGVTFLGGLLPLNGWDNILHILTALIAFGAYFASPSEDTADARQSPSTR
ncbi:MAG: DUF4383 domain-containing protein [Actinobacteria bacterium]|jgi:hypothetical protein|nr:DUF4383 domain-containing protein [Actinomycetota bacterium]